MAHVLTFTVLDRLAQLHRAAVTNARVAFSLDGGDHVIEGVARHFTEVNGLFISSGSDIRDAYLRISGISEHFLPVREVLALMDAGLFTTSAQ